MMLDDPFTARYCSNCGEDLKYDQVTKGGKLVGTRVVCLGCGEGGTSFSGPLSSEELFDLMFPNKDHLPPSLTSDLISALPPPPPPLPSQFSALGQEYLTYGFGAIVMAAHFPVFALAELEGRFFPRDMSYAGGRPGDPSQHVLSGVTLAYAGPSYERITECIIIEQEDAESLTADKSTMDFWAEESDFFSGEADQQELSSTADFSGDLDARDTVWFLERLLVPDAPDMRSLLEGKSIYRYINSNVVRQTPAVDVRIEHGSGEVSSWEIRRFKAPLPIAYAQAQIDNTQIKLGAIGAAGNDIENILSHLTRLTPESALADKFNEGWKAWREYRSKRLL
jgi:hypothetical protein